MVKHAHTAAARSCCTQRIALAVSPYACATCGFPCIRRARPCMPTSHSGPVSEHDEDRTAPTRTCNASLRASQTAQATSRWGRWGAQGSDVQSKAQSRCRSRPAQRPRHARALCHARSPSNQAHQRRHTEPAPKPAPLIQTAIGAATRGCRSRGWCETSGDYQSARTQCTRGVEAAIRASTWRTTLPARRAHCSSTTSALAARLLPVGRRQRQLRHRARRQVHAQHRLRALRCRHASALWVKVHDRGARRVRECD